MSFFGNSQRNCNSGYGRPQENSGNKEGKLAFIGKGGALGKSWDDQRVHWRTWESKAQSFPLAGLPQRLIDWAVVQWRDGVFFLLDGKWRRLPVGDTGLFLLESEKVGLNSTFKKQRSWHPVTYFIANRRGKSGNSDGLYFLGLQNHCR